MKEKYEPKERWDWSWLEKWPSGYKHRQYIPADRRVPAMLAARRFGRKLRTEKIAEREIAVWLEA